ncbi:MAG: hypothetical protein EON54_15165 [Alcaligenaceae bacterium]|nr:MAG: hypothetical protein EON54_15165 [Alcaligenaceae bacterium]
MTEQQFADAIGVTRGAVQQWEKVGGTAPSRRNQPRVAALLKVSLAELVSGGSTISSDAPMRAEVPIVSEIEAGNYTVIDNFKQDQALETVAVTVPVQRHTYALRVHGDSMVGDSGDSFPPGCLIIVEPDMAALPGDYVVALHEPDHTTFKQLIKDGADLYLKPLNSRYPIKLLGSAKIIGVVREFTKRFR